MTKKSPGDIAILELVDRDLAGEGAVGLVKDILGCDFDTRSKVLAGEEEVEGWWCDDDL